MHDNWMLLQEKKTNIDAERCLTCLNDNNENKKEQTNKYKKIYIAKKFVCL